MSTGVGSSGKGEGHHLLFVRGGEVHLKAISASNPQSTNTRRTKVAKIDSKCLPFDHFGACFCTSTHQTFQSGMRRKGHHFGETNHEAAEGAPDR